MTSRQRIDRSREGRLWISQVILPVGLAIAWIKTNPETNAWVKDKWARVKEAARIIKG